MTNKSKPVTHSSSTESRTLVRTLYFHISFEYLSTVENDQKKYGAFQYLQRPLIISQSECAPASRSRFTVLPAHVKGNFIVIARYRRVPLQMSVLDLSLSLFLSLSLSQRLCALRRFTETLWRFGRWITSPQQRPQRTSDAGVKTIVTGSGEFASLFLSVSL